MSAWSRIAVLAAGAAVGAAAGRTVGSDEGRRALVQAAQRGRAALEPAEQSDSAATQRENPLGSRVLRIAQDIRVGMNQAEGELRGQLTQSSPGRRPRGAAAAQQPGAGAEAGTALRLGSAPETSDEHTIIDHDWRSDAAADGSDRPGD